MGLLLLRRRLLLRRLLHLVVMVCTKEMGRGGEGKRAHGVGVLPDKLAVRAGHA